MAQREFTVMLDVFRILINGEVPEIVWTELLKSTEVTPHCHLTTSSQSEYPCV